jgi:cytochrome c oxidase subunit 3
MVETKKTGALENAQRPLSMHPNKFALWLFMITVTMLFAAFTSAYMVRAAEKDWLQFPLPDIFLINTLVLVLSSVTMHFAYSYAKKDELEKVKYYVLATLFLGVAFMVMQMTAGGYSLVNMGIPFGGKESNPAGSFVYVFFFVHVLHLVVGVGFLIYLYMETVKFKVHSKNMLQMEMSATFWHFLDLLWVYLYVFLFINN